MPPRRCPLAVALVVSVVASLLAVTNAVAPVGAAETRPNIVVVLLDDVRPDQLASMPNTLALIRDQGVEFTSAVANTPECCPSRANLFAGQYTHNHGVFRSMTPFGWAAFDEQNTLPIWLDEAGYFTAFTGKYLNGYGQQAPAAVPPGWDDWYAGFDPHTYDYYAGRVINTQGEIVQLGPEEYLTDHQNAHMVELIESHAGDAPMYLHYAPIASHMGSKPPSRVQFPYPALRHRGLFGAVPYPAGPNRNEEDTSDKPPPIASIAPFSASTLNGLDQAWRAAHETVMAVDEGVGMMVDALDEAGELDNTLFIVTSDNGLAYGEHRTFGKYWPYEAVLDIPLVMRGPGVPPGVVRPHTVGIIDLTATIVDAAGVGPSLPLDGISLLPLVADESLGVDRVMAAEGGAPGGTTTWRQARRGQHVFTRWESGWREFYDLGADPYQLDNAIDDLAYASVIAQLETDLDVLDDCVGATCRVGLEGYPTTLSVPVVGSIDPSIDTEDGGRSVTILGNGFTGATSVHFGSAAAPAVSVVSDTEVTAEAPPHVAGTVAVTVTTPGGTSAAGMWADTFEYVPLPAPPNVSTVLPVEVNISGGVPVTITGSGLTHAVEVTFDGVPGSALSVSSATQLTVVSPLHNAGAAEVVVSTPWAASNAGSVTYVDPPPAPTVTLTSPANGPAVGGTVVALTGTNFERVTGVRFGATEATSFTVNSPTSITAIAPPRAPGLVNVFVTTWGGTSPALASKTYFMYEYPVPDLDDVSPFQGSMAGGEMVNLTGTGFTGATSVTFGGVPARWFRVVSSTMITVITPPSAPYLVTVRVTTRGGTSPKESWSTFYEYENPSGAPVVTGRSPAKGAMAGGTVVTVMGSGFTGATEVTFGGVAGTSLQVLSSTELQVTTPPYPAALLVAIRVTGPGGTSPKVSWSTFFTYEPN